MKIILTTSTIAMIAAGIYGTIDLSADLKNGTMITYEGEEAPTAMRNVIMTVNSVKTNSISEKVAINEENKRKLLEAPVPINISDLSFESFSRGGFEYAPEELRVNLPKPDSTQAIVIDPAPTPDANEKPELNSREPKLDTARVEEEEQPEELNLRMYSRGGFKKHPKKITAHKSKD